MKEGVGIRIGQMANEYRRALCQGQDGVGLYLRVGRQYALCQARDDGFGQCEVLCRGVSASRAEGVFVRLSHTSMVNASLSFSRSLSLSRSLSFSLSFFSLGCWGAGFAPESNGSGAAAAAAAGGSGTGGSAAMVLSSSASANLATDTSLRRASLLREGMAVVEGGRGALRGAHAIPTGILSGFL